MELVNFAGLSLLSMVAAGLMCLMSINEFNGVSARKGFAVWCLLTVMALIVGIVIWVGVKLLVM